MQVKVVLSIGKVELNTLHTPGIIKIHLQSTVITVKLSIPNSVKIPQQRVVLSTGLLKKVMFPIQYLQITMLN